MLALIVLGSVLSNRPAPRSPVQAPERDPPRPAAAPFPLNPLSDELLPHLRVISSLDEVTCVALDPQYVWIGTRGGLLVVDRLTNATYKFTSADGLPGNVVTSVLREGSAVWVSTETGVINWDIPSFACVTRWDEELGPGLYIGEAGPLSASEQGIFLGEQSPWSTIGGSSCYSGGRWTAFPLPAEKHTGNSPMSLLGATGSDLWYSLGYDRREGPEQEVLARYSLDERRWYRYRASDGLPRGNPRAIAETPEGIWLVAETGGLALLGANGWSRSEPVVLASNPVSSVAVSDGELLLGTEKGLVRSQPWELAPGSPPDIVAVAADGGEVWCGTAYDGVWQREPDGRWHRLYESDGPLSAGAYCAEFGDNAAYFGGPLGISVLSLGSGTWQRWTEDDGILPGHITALALDGTTLWYVAASQPTGAASAPRYALSSVDVRTAESSTSQITGVRDVTVAGPGLLLLQYGSSLELYDVAVGRSRSVGRFDVHLQRGGEDDDHHCVVARWPDIWYGIDRPGDLYSGAALMHYNDTTGTASELATFRMGYGISAVLPHGDALWVASYGGDPSLAKVGAGTAQESGEWGSAAWITSLAWLGQSLWTGSGVYEGERTGLCRYAASVQLLASYTTRNGLPSDEIVSLHVRGNDLWVVTPAGVAIFTPGTWPSSVKEGAPRLREANSTAGRRAPTTGPAARAGRDTAVPALPGTASGVAPGQPSSAQADGSGAAPATAEMAAPAGEGAVGAVGAARRPKYVVVSTLTS